jgi:putative transposase
MVRAGAVKHPSGWPYCGYNEIQTPKRKNILINYEKLQDVLGYDNYQNLQAAHEKWIESQLENVTNLRDEKWTGSLAVGSKAFVENAQALMGASAKVRKLCEAEGLYQLREAQDPYIDDFGSKKGEIGPENTIFWQ